MNQNQDPIQSSKLISRDLSWLRFNQRVLDQTQKEGRSFLDRLKFLAITASNSDEFFMIRVGSLYNYLDYNKERVDYSGLHATQFKLKLFEEISQFHTKQHGIFLDEMQPKFQENHFKIANYKELTKNDKIEVKKYFTKTIFPMLTPMVYDSYHSFPILNNNILILGVVTKAAVTKEKKKVSFIQMPQNLPRFFEIIKSNQVVFIPIEEIVRNHLHDIFKKVTIISADLFRVTRNGDFTLEESDDIEANFLDEVRKKLKSRKTGRVVRIEAEENFSKWLLKKLINKFEIDENNIMWVPTSSLIDFTRLWQIISHPKVQQEKKSPKNQVLPLSIRENIHDDIFKIIQSHDVLLHHPYNSMEPLLDLIEKSADDPYVLSIKLTIYRLAKNSRVTEALLKAAENGKHVSVLFEVKARFDEENNMKEARRLQNAGCFVIYGVGSLKTHTKLLLIVRKEKEKVTRFVHMSSGNYNESTSKLYTDLSLMTSNEEYANDVQEFFNVITGHSLQNEYKRLITAPQNMRKSLIKLINIEKENKLKGKPSGIIIKINSLQDKDIVLTLYEASKAGVPIKLIVRGICCLRPNRKNLSETIEVRSIVGEYLEHSRIYYFHNGGEAKIYSGSADMMVRSFDRRIESLFEVCDELSRQHIMYILEYNLKDNANAYIMKEDGSYSPIAQDSQNPINIHEDFFEITKEKVATAKLF